MVLFDVTGNAKPEPKILDDFHRADGARFLYIPARHDANARPEGVPATLTAKVDIVGDTLQLQLCADRNQANADPGTYNGDVLLVGGSISKPIDLPIKISLSDTRTRFLVPFLFTLTIIIGSSYAWILDKKRKADEPIFAAEAFKDYLGWWRSTTGFLSVAFGLVAAAGIFNAQYLAADAFGSSGWQYITLGASMIGGFVSAATITRIPGGAGSTGANANEPDPAKEV